MYRTQNHAFLLENWRFATLLLSIGLVGVITLSKEGYYAGYNVGNTITRTAAHPTGLAFTRNPSEKLETSNFQSFTTIANSNNPVTDKVTTHSYGVMYDRYFTEVVCNKPVKFLEIGLGCGMDYGPGASADIWPKLFKNAEIWFGEYDEACVKRVWNDGLPWKYVAGDQADVAVLASWVEKTGGNFDYIIDDGGHTNVQIWNTFQHLFNHALKPGGVYFIEDMQVNRVGGWYVGGVPGGNGKVMIDVITDWIDQLLVANSAAEKTYAFPLPANILKIDCMKEMCAITKA